MTGKAICRRGGQELISATIAAAAERIEADDEEHRRFFFVDAEYVDAILAQRTTKASAEDTALYIYLAASCAYYEMRVALRLAERVLQDHPNHPVIMDALLTLRDRLEADPLHVSGFFRAKILPWMRTLLASQTPDGLLDLGFIDQRCAWGRSAALAISHRAETEPSAGQFVLHLSSPTGTRAAKKWWTETQELMAEPWRRELVRELSDYLTTCALTARDDVADGLDAPEQQLVVLTNQVVARGVMWAECFSVDNAAPARVAAVVERAGDPFRGWDGLTPRCSKVALASIRALAEMEPARASDELTRLFGVLKLAALIRPIGKALDYSEADIKARIRAK